MSHGQLLVIDNTSNISPNDQPYGIPNCFTLTSQLCISLYIKAGISVTCTQTTLYNQRNAHSLALAGNVRQEKQKLNGSNLPCVCILIYFFLHFLHKKKKKNRYAINSRYAISSCFPPKSSGGISFEFGWSYLDTLLFQEN